MSNAALHLQIEGWIPAKKNNKLLCRGRLITQPKYQQRIAEIVDQLKSQCASSGPPAAAAISPTPPKPSWMRWLPRDDCWTKVPIVVISGELGEERCEITIETICKMNG